MLQILFDILQNLNDAFVVQAESGLTNPIKSTSILDFFESILVGLRKLFIPIIMIVLMITGFKLIVAKQKGEPEKMADVKKSIIYVLIGSFILLSSPSLISFLKATLDTLFPGA